MTPKPIQYAITAGPGLLLDYGTVTPEGHFRSDLNGVVGVMSLVNQGCEVIIGPEPDYTTPRKTKRK